MKKQTIAMLLMAALAAPLALSAQSVTGHVNQRTDASGFPDPDGELRTISFNAVTHADGRVTGQVQIKNRFNGNTGHADIGCLVVQGNQAWLAATFTKVTEDSGVPVGATFILGVEDNGEGANAAPDRLTILAIFTIDEEGTIFVPIELYCELFTDPGFFGVDLIPIEANTFGIPIFDSEGGNIQINPERAHGK